MSNLEYCDYLLAPPINWLSFHFIYNLTHGGRLVQQYILFFRRSKNWFIPIRPNRRFLSLFWQPKRAEWSVAFGRAALLAFYVHAWAWAVLLWADFSPVFLFLVLFCIEIHRLMANAYKCLGTA